MCSIVVWEMQIKVMMRDYFISKVKKHYDTQVWWEIREKSVGNRNVKFIAFFSFLKQFGSFIPKNLSHRKKSTNM